MMERADLRGRAEPTQAIKPCSQVDITRENSVGEGDLEVHLSRVEKGGFPRPVREHRSTTRIPIQQNQ